MMASPQQMQTDEEQVLSANRAFYAAMRSLDVSVMDEVWLHENWVKCLHPGWELLTGWSEIGGSWREIFASTGQMMVSISRSVARVAGDVAWVSCLENVTTVHQNDASSAMVEATNIFERHRGRWLMVHHHTTPLIQPPPDTSTPVQ